MKKKILKTLLELEYYEDNSIPEKGSYKWWPVSVNLFDDLLVHTYEDSEFFQMHLKWSRKSLEELWKYLINLAHYKTSDPDYHDHFDHFDNIKWNTAIVIHHPDSVWHP